VAVVVAHITQVRVGLVALVVAVQELELAQELLEQQIQAVAAVVQVLGHLTVVTVVLA